MFTALLKQPPGRRCQRLSLGALNITRQEGEVGLD
jgi:hypothetical protein